MVYKQNNELKLATTKVKYIQHREELEQAIGEEGNKWWEDFAEKWEHTEIVGFEDIVYSQDVLDRFEEIKNLDLADSLANDYVMNSVVCDGLELLIAKKENENLKKMLADLTEVVLMGGM